MREAIHPTAETSAKPKTGFVQAGLLLILLFLGVGIYFTPVGSWLMQGQLLKAKLQTFGSAAPLVFVFMAALLTAVGAPRLLLCSLGGIAFGAAKGLLWSQLGTLLGAYAAFLTVRLYGRVAILERYPQLGRFSGRIEEKGLMAVLLIRQLPMNGFYNTLLLGLSPVGHRDFLIGSLVGYLPLGATAVLIGAGVVQTSVTGAVQYAAAGLAAFILLGFLLKRLASGYRTRNQRAPLPLPSAVDPAE